MFSVTFDFECTYIKEVQYNCSVHRSVHLFIIAISRHSHKEQKESQFFFFLFFFHIQTEYGELIIQRDTCLQFECRITCKMFKNSFFYRTLVAVSKSRNVFRNQSNIYKGVFLKKIVNAYKPLTVFTKKLNHR